MRAQLAADGVQELLALHRLERRTHTWALKHTRGITGRNPHRYTCAQKRTRAQKLACTHRSLRGELGHALRLLGGAFPRSKPNGGGLARQQPGTHVRRRRALASQHQHHRPVRAGPSEQALHAVTVTALGEARRHTRPPACSKQKMHKAPLDEANQPRPWSTARIVGKIVREYDKIARRRADQLQLQQLHNDNAAGNRTAYVEFHKAWVVTGLATIKKGRVCTLALANWRNPQTDDPQQPLLVFATDGSGAKGQAGYGATAIRTTGADLQTHTTTAYTRDRVVTEEAGRVVTDPRRPEYIGAVRPTNNTGELSGVTTR